MLCDYINLWQTLKSATNANLVIIARMFVSVHIFHSLLVTQLVPRDRSTRAAKKMVNYREVSEVDLGDRNERDIEDVTWRK